MAPRMSVLAMYAHTHTSCASNGIMRLVTKPRPLALCLIKHTPTHLALKEAVGDLSLRLFDLLLLRLLLSLELSLCLKLLLLLLKHQSLALRLLLRGLCLLCIRIVCTGTRRLRSSWGCVWLPVLVILYGRAGGGLWHCRRIGVLVARHC